LAFVQVFIAEIKCDVHVCAKRNTHGRSLAEIQKIAATWESTPPHMNKLDLRLLMQDSEIQEVGFTTVRFSGVKRISLTQVSFDGALHWIVGSRKVYWRG